ncbi:MAG: nitrogen fixation protein FixH [Limisphaerales bacterium]|nr:MAG: nitrogen fixation protein FixH [Limisphaerales bacterium]KAG0508190.1 MAG: nitrogen fixation protein FixH [Limisphaerales bacterium]TXT51398.1 MAG: nitrogen fixation protein FixH [Limisphaerales bacterium]
MNANAIKPAPPRSLWPYAIIGWFLLFGTAMAAWIVVAVRNDMDLVRADYYDQEIRHQQQIDRQARTHPIQSEVKVAYDDAQQRITVALPAAHAAQARGRINFYRPSDAKLDREMKLAVNSAGEQMLDAKSLQPGLWKVRVQWSVAGDEFYFDQTVVITPSRSAAFTPQKAGAECGFRSTIEVRAFLRPEGRAPLAPAHPG